MSGEAMPRLYVLELRDVGEQAERMRADGLLGSADTAALARELGRYAGPRSGWPWCTPRQLFADFLAERGRVTR